MRVAEVGHDREVVLDHQHRPAPRHLPDQRRDPAHVLVAHAGGGLVEQHELRVERDRGRDLERALAAVGQLDRRHGGMLGDADGIEQLARPAVVAVERPLGAPEVERFAAPALEGDPDVLQRGEVAEHGRDLERADQAHLGHVGGLGARDVAPFVGDPPARGGEELGEQVEAGGLAGAVGADQRVDGTAANPQRHVLDRVEAAELLAEPLGREDLLLGHSCPAFPALPARNALASLLTGTGHGATGERHRGQEQTAPGSR